jgi:hypothetical protein
MSLPTDIHFFEQKDGHMWIYLQELTEFEIRVSEATGSEATGRITFDGYCRYDFPGEENGYRSLPERITLCVTYPNEEKGYVYTIQFLTRTIHEDTSEYWSDEEEGRICLTPTEKQTITFKILSEH